MLTNEKSVAQYIQHLKETKSTNTVNNYTSTMKELEAHVENNGGSLDDLTRHDLQSFLQRLNEKNSSTTVRNKFACIQSYLQFHKRSNLLEGLNIPKQRNVMNIAPKSLERNEMNKLLRDVEREGSTRNIAIVYTLLFTGIRVAELVALNREDITISERSGMLIVRKGKGNVSRRVPIAKEVRYWLKKYMDERADDKEPLFLSNYNNRISVRAVQHMLQKLGVHAHELRHTFGRLMTAEGTDISTVAELMGHVDINITRRYSKPNENELTNAIDKVFS
jgi:integrase/recombinase XerD